MDLYADPSDVNSGLEPDQKDEDFLDPQDDFALPDDEADNLLVDEVELIDEPSPEVLTAESEE